MSIKALALVSVEMPVKYVKLNAHQTPNNGQGASFTKTQCGFADNNYDTNWNIPVPKKSRKATKAEKAKKPNKKGKKAKQNNNKTIDFMTKWKEDQTPFEYVEKLIFRLFRPVDKVPAHMILKPEHMHNNMSMFCPTQMEIEDKKKLEGKDRVELGIKFADHVFQHCANILTKRTPCVIKNHLFKKVNETHGDRLQKRIQTKLNVICAENDLNKVTFDSSRYEAYFKDSYDDMAENLKVDYTIVRACMVRTMKDIHEHMGKHEHTPERMHEYAESKFSQKVRDVKVEKKVNINHQSETDVINLAAMSVLYELILNQYSDIHNCVVRLILTMCKYMHVESIAIKLANAYLDSAVNIMNGITGGGTNIIQFATCLDQLNTATVLKHRTVVDQINDVMNSNIGSLSHQIKFDGLMDPDFLNKYKDRTAAFRRVGSKAAKEHLHKYLRIDIDGANTLKNCNLTLLNTNKRSVDVYNGFKNNVNTLTNGLDMEELFFSLHPEYEQACDYKFYKNRVEKHAFDMFMRSDDTVLRTQLYYGLDEFHVPLHPLIKHVLAPVAGDSNDNLEQCVSNCNVIISELEETLKSNASYTVSLEKYKQLQITSNKFNDATLKQGLNYYNNLPHVTSSAHDIAQSSISRHVDSLRRAYVSGNLREGDNKNEWFNVLKGFVDGLITTHYKSPNFNGIIYEQSKFERDYSNQLHVSGQRSWNYTHINLTGWHISPVPVPEAVAMVQAATAAASSAAARPHTPLRPADRMEGAGSEDADAAVGGASMDRSAPSYNRGCNFVGF